MIRRSAFAAVAGMLAAGLLHAPPASAGPYSPPTAQREPMVRGTSQKPRPTGTPRTGKPFAPAPASWPAGTEVEVQLPAPRARLSGDARPVTVPGLPVTVDPTGSEPDAPDRVRVRSFDRPATAAAHVDGLLLAVSRTDGVSRPGSVRVSVDYRGFRSAYGGDWASRLRLRVVPECALTSPGTPLCASRDVTSVNDVRAGTVAGRVEVAATGRTLLAVTADSGGPTGDYAATSLSPQAAWTAGGNAGDFTWSYPLRVPPSLGGPAPSIAFSYSSASVDGRMAAANNQPSWIGEGFDWSPGAIERRYTTCSEDMASKDNNPPNNTVKTGDLCWDTDNATISLAGHAGELIKDATNPNRWHLRTDDGTYVERRTGGGNGDNDGEWWVVRTTDGTEHWFGGRPASGSTLTVPVFGNHSGEPCRQTSFASSSCQQAWRWQLDHVVDRHGNTMTLTYVKETNRYGKNNTPTNPAQYDRAGYLEKIEYGTRTGATGIAPMRVLFRVENRCLSGCTTKDGTHWPDVPWDRDCAVSPCNSTAPTFWTTKRLGTVTTQVWNAAASAHEDVESWTLTHSFPDPTDSLTAGLWLEKISHSGHVGGTNTALPDVSFVGTALTNRVDTGNDQYPAMTRFRIETVNLETGGKIDVSYSGRDCDKSTGRLPDKQALHANVLRCYPVRWTPAGHPEPIDDYFHKYLVTDVVEADSSVTTEGVVTNYRYLGDPAWRYTDDDGLIATRNKTWSVWRGYGAVRTTKGRPGEQTQVETRYFRGMHGDKLPTGTRTVTLPAIPTGNIPPANDEDAFAGMVRETITQDGPDGAEVTATVAEPWQSAPTASRTVNGVTVHARFTGTAAEHTRTALDGGRAPRTSTKRVTFDSYGMPVKVDDAGDNADANDQKCLLTDYIRNTAAHVWILDAPSRERTYAVDCARANQGGLTDDDVVNDKLISYDQLAWNVAPTKGSVSKTEVLEAWNGGSPAYLTDSQATHDEYGRVILSWDVRQNLTRTAYTPAAGGPVTARTVTRVVTDTVDWVTTTTYDPSWGLPRRIVDPNDRVVEYAYDGLGRLTAVWFPGRLRSQTPNLVYEYRVRTDGPLVLTTKRLNPAGNYITSYQFFDGLARLRQTQDADGAGGTGAVVTDTQYDSAGRVRWTHDSYLACRRVGTDACQPVPPSTDPFLPEETIPAREKVLYDGAGRETAQIHLVGAPPTSDGGDERWRTTTSYGGDRVDVTPPDGGVTTSTITDGTGRTVEVRYYRAGVAAGSGDGFDRLSYTYNRKGLLARVVDPAGMTWTYGYDLKGRQTTVTDPDKGTASTVFDRYGDVESTTDGRGVTIAYTYDQLGRKTTMRDGATTGPLRARWDYDVLNALTTVKGKLIRTTRYADNAEYVTEIGGFKADYQPQNIVYRIPSSETGLGGDYNYIFTYHQDGSEQTVRIPGAGNLATETITRGYNSHGKPSTLNTTPTLGSTYVTGTDYTSYHETGAIHLRNNGGNRFDIERRYETDTRRLEQIKTTRQVDPATVADVHLDHDDAGNVEWVADLAAGDTQCFATDHLRQLAQAWTPADGDCGPAPSLAALGGPAKYWHTYEYDKVGNRTKLVEHGTAAGDRTTTYTTQAGTHRLAGTSTLDGGGTTTGSYSYDASGNTITRPTTGTGTQSLTWDAEGRLATSQDATGTTSYLYDVDGNRLIREDPTGKTLYLPGQELRYTASNGEKTCTRYYTHAGQTVATRTGSGVTWLSADHHGTAQISVSAVHQTVATRRETPFGSPRGSTGTWPSAMDKGFVGGTRDNTGLTHLGAREYDPLIGRFVSVDPLIDITDPQQMNGYAYAANAPITASDPLGLLPDWLERMGDHAMTTAKKIFQPTPGDNLADSTMGAVADHAGLVSAVTGVAAVACTVIPGAQVAVPALLAVSWAAGAIDTYRTCGDDHTSLDCQLGAIGLVPGGRAITGAGKGAYQAWKMKQVIADINRRLTLLKNWRHGKSAREAAGYRDAEGLLRRELREARDALKAGQAKIDDFLSRPPRPTSIPRELASPSNWLTYESFGWETYRLGAYDEGDSYDDASRPYGYRHGKLVFNANVYVFGYRTRNPATRRHTSTTPNGGGHFLS